MMQNMGGSLSNMSPMIQAIIGGVIVVVLAFVAYPFMISNADKYYLEYVEHCEAGSESFLRLYDKPDAGDNLTTAVVTITKELCEATEPNGVTDLTAKTPTQRVLGAVLVTEHEVPVAKNASSSPATMLNTATWDRTGTTEWVTVPEVLDRYSGITRLVLSVLPIIAVTGFLSISAGNLYQYGRGSGGDSIVGAVGWTVGALVATIVVLFMGPVILDKLVDTAAASDGDRYAIFQNFGGIVDLVLGFVPVVFSAGLIILFGWQGANTLNKFRSGGRGM